MRLVELEENFPDLHDMLLDLLRVQSRVRCGAVDHGLLGARTREEPLIEGLDFALRGAVALVQGLGDADSDGDTIAHEVLHAGPVGELGEEIGEVGDCVVGVDRAVGETVEAVQVDQLAIEGANDLDKVLGRERELTSLILQG